MFTGLPLSELIEISRSQLNDRDGTFFSDRDLIDWANLAVRQIGMVCGFRQEVINISLEAAVGQYPLKLYTPVAAIKRVVFVKSPTHKVTLMPVSQRVYDELTGIDKTVQGDPVRYFVHGDSIYLSPIPDRDIVNGLEVWADVHAEPMARVYRTGTVAVVRDSISVTGTGTAWANRNNVKLGCVFGVGDRPIEWYRIAEIVSDTSIRLVDPYRAASATGQKYVISDVPAIDEQMQFAIVDYMVAMGLMRERATIEFGTARLAVFNNMLREGKIAIQRSKGKGKLPIVQDRDRFQLRRDARFGLR